MCKPPRLPEAVFNELHHLPDPVPENEEHYKSSSSLYGIHTTERDRPSKKEGARKAHGIPFSPNSQTARAVIMCSECLRPRVIYSQYRLNYSEESVLSQSIEGLLYTCGSSLQGLQVETHLMDPPTVKTLFKRVYVRKNLTCNDPIEVAYYSSERFQLICTHCACVCELVVEGQYPICDFCRQQGLMPIFKRKRKSFSSSN